MHTQSANHKRSLSSIDQPLPKRTRTESLIVQDVESPALQVVLKCTDLIQCIGKFLLPHEAWQSRLVCKDWHHALYKNASFKKARIGNGNESDVRDFWNKTISHWLLIKTKAKKATAEEVKGLEKDFNRFFSHASLEAQRMLFNRATKDELMLLISSLPKDLEKIQLPRASIEQIQELVQRIPTLKELNLSGCKGLTNAISADLATLQNLTSLNLSGCIELDDAIGKDLAVLQNLTSLNLSGCRGLYAIGKDLAALRNLTSLNLSSCYQLTYATGKDLAALQNLTSLNLSRCDWFTDFIGPHLASLQSLTSLNLAGCLRLTNTISSDLASLKNLTSLNLSACDKLTDAIGADLASLKNLTSLKFSPHIVKLSTNF